MVVEAAGVLPAFPEGVDLAGNHGRYIVLGLWGAIGTQPISPRDLTLKNLTIGGATFPKPKHYHGAMHMAVRLQERVPLAALVTHRFGIAQANQALDLVKAGNTIKAINNMMAAVNAYTVKGLATGTASATVVNTTTTVK